MEKQYPKVIKKNILSKILDWLFNRKTIQTKENDINNINVEKNNFLDEIKIENEENSDIIRIQKQFENDNINLSVLSDEDIDKLNSLYEKQIADLDIKLKHKKNELNLLKNKINNI